MDPLSVTASVITVATLALESCTVTYTLIDRLVEAPQVIARSKNSLTKTQKTVDALQQVLMTKLEPPSVLDSVLGVIELDETLKSIQRVCDEFSTIITSFTSHSTDGKFSNRDRITVNLHESKIRKLDRELGDCQQTLSMVVVSLNLIVTTRTADDLRRLGDRFQVQEQALATLDTQLYHRQNFPLAEEGSAYDRDASLQLTTALRKLCQQALWTTQAKRSGQKFGDMCTDDQSMAVQGIVGDAHDGIEQSFGKMTTSKNSKAFQGQMDASSFATMFRKP